MVNKDFCLSSYIAFRYIWKDGMDFYKGFKHDLYKAIPESEKIPVVTSEDIDREIQKQVDALYAKYDNIGILLSGGMDSANLAAYLKPGSHAYTFYSNTGVFDADVERAKTLLIGCFSVWLCLINFLIYSKSTCSASDLP